MLSDQISVCRFKRHSSLFSFQKILIAVLENLLQMLIVGNCLITMSTDRVSYLVLILPVFFSLSSIHKRIRISSGLKIVAYFSMGNRLAAPELLHQFLYFRLCFLRLDSFPFRV